MLYFDHAATTAVYPELNELIARIQTENFYNPSALYAPALAARRTLETARSELAGLLGAATEEIYFTSSATEANNWILKSHCFNPARARIVITAGEHASVRQTAAALGARGAQVEVVPLGPDGRIDETALFGALDARVTLVSMIHVGNETGALNDVGRLAREIKEEYPGIMVHSDGVQAFCKTPIAVHDLDAYSVSAHKVHGPKGVGALYLNRKRQLDPLLCGGGQERGARSGTENVAGAAAFAAAARRCRREFDAACLAELRQRIVAALQGIPGGFVNSACAEGDAPHILSCGVAGIRGETLVHALGERGIVIGTGSACSAHAGGNETLEAMGTNAARILSSVRISLDMSNTAADVDTLCAAMQKTAAELQRKLK